MVCVSAAAAWDPAQLGVRSDLDGAVRHDRHCRLAGLAPHDIHATAAAVGLATCRQCLLDPGILRTAQSAAGARRLSRAAGPDRADDAGVQERAAAGRLADGALSRLELLCDLSYRRVLVAESALS